MEEPRIIRTPSFFKAFCAEDGAQRLKLPLAFTSHIKGNLPNQAFLRNRHGNLWLVVVAEIGNGQFSFEHGWAKFVEQNHVVLGDFFVFQYDGQSIFDFKLFGQTTCEKKVIEFSDFKVKIKQVEEEKEEVAREREEKSKIKTGSSATSAYAERGLDDDDEKDDDINEAIFESGEIIHPVNPFFVTKKRSKRSELYVPHDVVKKFDLKLPNKINIRDEGKRIWKSKVHVWKDGRTWISKGWRAFCKWNNVRPDDRCICEFVPATEQTDIFLKVRIVRA